MVATNKESQSAADSVTVQSTFDSHLNEKVPSHCNGADNLFQML